MKTLTLKTIGAAPEDVMTFDAQVIANALQAEVSGGNATPFQAEHLTQDFINKYEIKARYASGTLMSFKISDEALSEFMTFPKR